MIGAAIISVMGDGQPASRIQRNPALPFLPAPSLRESKEQAEDAKRIHEQIVYVEKAVYIWERAMYGIVVFLAVVGIALLLMPWLRWPYLLAAIVILVSTRATLTGFHLLIDPTRGGMPILSIWIHIMVVVVQSAYSIVMLIAYERNTKIAERATLRQVNHQRSKI